MIITTTNAITGETTHREASAEEAKDLVEKGSFSKELEKQAEANAIAKAALLTKLGITADEAKLLLA